MRYSDYVDPYIGSIGHLLTATQPLVFLPHCMAQIRPILDEEIKDIYLARRIFGFPLNASSIMPDIGGAPSFASAFDHDLESVHCYEGKVLLEDSGIEAGYTVTEHCAVYRFSYPDGQTALLRAVTGEEGEIGYENGILFGHEKKVSTEHYFAASFSHEPESFERSGNTITFTFAPGACVTVKAGSSYIDVAQAKYNLSTETSGREYDDIVTAAREIWDMALGRIEAEGGSEKQTRIFYTSLYRVYQRMINITEYGRYYSPFDKQLHEDARPFYINDGIWDTYRGAHPLQLLLEPDRQSDIIESYIRMYDQCGHIPSFPHIDGSRAVMIGKHTTAMIADAYIKGLRGFDIEKAWKGMVHNEEDITKLPWALAPINEFDKCYFEKGFFPALPAESKEWLTDAHSFERRQCVTVTLETCYDEWVLAQLGAMLGKKDAAKYAARAHNYVNVYNRETGFMSPRLADGSWVPDFDPKLSGGQGGRAYFAECNSWTYTLHVQHDIDGLAALMGGKKALESYLDRMFTEQYDTSKFSFLGQFPDSTGLIGQYCMGNEPSFHIPYMYNYTDSPWKTQRAVRDCMKIWYDDTPLGICGDEDGGAMSAWYVFSAIGLYPTCPGKPEYDITSPLFKKVRIHLAGGNVFEIDADNTSAANKYIAAIELNGAAFTGTRISHADIVSGGKLKFTLSSRHAPET